MPRRPKRPPHFMGQPSPSLAKLERMNREQIKAHMERLEQEKQRVAAKLERLKAIDSPPERLKTLEDQFKRLDALQRVAEEKLTQKQSRAEQWPPRRPRR